MTGHQGALPRPVPLENLHRLLLRRGAGRREPVLSLRTSAGAALLPSRVRHITTLEVSEFLNIIKASIPGSEQQAQSLHMSGRDEFG